MDLLIILGSIISTVLIVKHGMVRYERSRNPVGLSDKEMAEDEKELERLFEENSKPHDPEKYLDIKDCVIEFYAVDLNIEKVIYKGPIHNVTDAFDLIKAKESKVGRAITQGTMIPHAMVNGNATRIAHNPITRYSILEESDAYLIKPEHMAIVVTKYGYELNKETGYNVWTFETKLQAIGE